MYCVLCHYITQKCFHTHHNNYYNAIWVTTRVVTYVHMYVVLLLCNPLEVDKVDFRFQLKSFNFHICKCP